MSANPNANQVRPGQPAHQRPPPQIGGGGGGPAAVNPAILAAGHQALAYFKAQNISIPQAMQLAQQKKLNPEQQKSFQIVMAAFGTQIMASRAAGAPGAAGGAGANGPSPPPAAAVAAPTAAPQARPPGAPGAPAAGTTAGIPQERIKHLLETLQNMTEHQRASAIQAQPALGNLWQSYIVSRQQRGAAGTGPGVRPPAGQVRPPGAVNGLPAGTPAPPLNLQLPPGRARPPPNAQPQQQQQQNGNMAGRASPALQQQQQQQQRLQNGGNPASRVGSPAQMLQQQQQNGQNPAVNGPVPVLRPNQGTSAAALAALPSNSPAPHPNAGGARPTLSTGLASGPVTGTPSLLSRPGGGWDEAQRGRVGGPVETEDGRKRKLREMVESLEPGEKLEQGVEDLLLELVDEMIDSSTQMAARLAKHRKSSTLEVKDLQLHLEKNHNIRVPGISSDEIRQNQAQTARRTPVVNLHAQRVAMVHAAKAAAAAKANAAA